MKTARQLFALLLPLLLGTLTLVGQQQPAKAHAAPSEETSACVDCHKNVTPGIVEDWLASRHARTAPKDALIRPAAERRISAGKVAPSLDGVAVGCYECHSLNPSSHKDNFEHFGYKINIVVSPSDCKECHPAEVEQFVGSKKYHALGNLRDNPVYHTLLDAVNGVKTAKNGKLSSRPSSESTKHETCYACHGTVVEVKGMKTVASSLGDVEVPHLTNWPSQGVGRVNPDGSLGACTACHPRHSFSIAVARKPYTCAQCHLQPDVPAWDVYKESKHGNIMFSQVNEQDWDAVPWKVGKDLRTPTCATCHNSHLTNGEGETIVDRSHDFGARLWVRIFGLVYSHPQPSNGNTALLKNQDGLPLPTTFGMRIASSGLIDKAEQDRRQLEMKKVCSSCHSSSWSDGVFAKLARTTVETDSMVLAATQLLSTAWERKLADRSNPFDEAIEQMWVKQWLFYANSVRYGSAMGGPDYATFGHGWWDLTHNLEEMRHLIALSHAKK
jgi:hypothetical protein